MNSEIKILLIEDDSKKIVDIKSFLSSDLGYNKLTVKESYQSGLKELFLNTYDLLLLDMSIPTWDKSPTESGGNYEKFGGYKILKELVRKEKPVKTILITMFDDFGESDASITLSQLNSVLQNEFSEMYLGAVSYISGGETWEEDFKSLIQKL